MPYPANLKRNEIFEHEGKRFKVTHVYNAKKSSYVVEPISSQDSLFIAVNKSNQELEPGAYTITKPRIKRIRLTPRNGLWNIINNTKNKILINTKKTDIWLDEMGNFISTDIFIDCGVELQIIRRAAKALAKQDRTDKDDAAPSTTTHLFEYLILET